MPSLTLKLNDAESARLESQARRLGTTRQAVLRAALLCLYGDAAAGSVARDSAEDAFRASLLDHIGETRRQVETLARDGATIEGEHLPGVQRGYSREDYQRALDEAGTMNGAARVLGVNASTAREQILAYKLKPRKRRPRQ